MRESDKLIDVDAQDVFPEHFGVPGNRNIYMAMVYLKSKNIKAEPMAIMEVLTGDARKTVEEMGGLDYLLTMQETRTPTDNLPIFIEKVKQNYARRSMHNIAEEIKHLVMSDKANVLNPSEIIEFANQKIADLGVNTSGDIEIYKMGDDVEARLKERSENPQKVPGLEVGWEQVDDLTGGLRPGDLVIVCAPSKTGKSVTLTNWASKLGITDKLPVLYIDTEMSRNDQEDRLLANVSGLPIKEIENGMYVMDTINGTAAEKTAKIKDAREKLDMGNYYHIYMPQFTIEKVTAIVRKFQMQFGLSVLMFDYIKIPSNQADFRTAQEYQKLGFFTSGLKDLAGMLQIPVVTAAQANKEDVGLGGPDENNIGGSYRILQLATKLMFLYNKTEEKIARHGPQNGNQELWIKFQRNGKSDCPPINIMFDRETIRQSEV